MKKAVFTILLLALVLVPETSSNSSTQVRASAPATIFIPLQVMTSAASPSVDASTPSKSEQVSSFGLSRSQQDWLYPQDIDPPETCHVSRIAPLGQDVEHMLAPWDSLNPLVALDQPPAWKADFELTGAEPASELEIVALNTEELVATWQDASDGFIYVAEWDTISAWHGVKYVDDVSSSGKPAILSRGPVHYAVFARFENTIMLAEYYMDSLGAWQLLPNVDDAATDPLVITLDAGHMAVFYQTADGTLKFTEWEGAWLKEPISLSGPQAALATQMLAPQISIVSRNENHLAVFAVNADGELWVRERMKADAPDWSNTHWVKLMEDVEIASPAVASRHDNHIGVVVKDASGQPIYLWWSFPHVASLYLPVVVNSSTAATRLASAPSQEVLAWDPTGLWAYGWHAPVPLGDLDFTSGMTLVPRSLDSLSVFGIAGNILYERIWSEQEGWGSWQEITPNTIRADQTISAVVPRMNAIMLLGRYANQNQAWSKQYSSQGEAVAEKQLSGPTSGYPRAQAVVIAEGRTVWVSLVRDPDTGNWQVKAQEISTSILATLDLNHTDSGQVTNRVSVAAADLEVDGSEEIVVATLQSNQTNIDLSVLEISFPTPDTLEIQADHATWQGIPEGDDVNVAVGDMDPDTYQKEIVVGYRGTDAMHIGVYQYGEGGLTQPVITAQTPYYWDDWCTQSGQDGDCSVGSHDMEIAIGHVFDRYQGYKFIADQLVILDLAHMQGKCVTDPAQCAPGFCTISPTDLQCVDYVQDYVDTLYINSDDDIWSLDQIEPFFNEVVTDTHTTSPLPAVPYTGAIGIGDMNADGGQDIVYTFSDRIVASRVSYESIETVAMHGFPDQERSLAVGDIDLDGRAEAGVAYRQVGSTAYELVEMVSDDQMLVSASHPVNGSRTLLVADTDNDTQIAELAGCKIFADFTVIAVVNGVPRWYTEGQPIQENGGYYGRTDSSGGGDVEDGTTETYGGSITVGYEHEWEIPVTGVKVAAFRASVTGEFMYSTISETVSITSTTQEDGYQFGEYSLGMVVYNSTQFACYYYDVYPPATPENRNRAMVCKPTGRSSFEDFKPLEDWHSSDFKQSAGPSWVDVGHRSAQGARSNDLDVQGNYGTKLPVDASTVMYTWDDQNPKRVSYSSLGGFESYWGISQMEGGEQEERDSYAWNVTGSVGFDVYDFKVDVSGTYGQGWEEARMVTWEETLEIGGLVEKFQDDTRECYDVVPFVYTARAVTGAGMVYDYTEMDYYVPWIGDCVLDVEEAGSSMPSDLPHPE